MEIHAPDWHQQTRREELRALLGAPAAARNPVASHLVRRDSRGSYELEVLLLDLDESAPVPAYFVKPRGRDGSPLPAVLYNHAHGDDFALGKDELLDGRDILDRVPYADALTSCGYAVLCIDARGFGPRRDRSLDELFKEMLWHGKVLWGAMVQDSLRAIDYLISRPDVDEARIGTLGMSMGSTMAWWVAALDTRLRVCVDICCLTDFQTLVRSRGLDRHGVYYYVPNLLNHFTTAEINALIAPRAHLALAGSHDPLTPPEGLDVVDRELREVYSRAGVAGRWRLRRFDCGHEETAAMRAEAIEFLRKWL